MTASQANLEALTALRIRSGVGPRELCRAAGISESTLYRIEKGDVSPRIGTLKRIADALDVPLTAILASREAAA